MQLPCSVPTENYPLGCNPCNPGVSRVGTVLAYGSSVIGHWGISPNLSGSIRGGPT